MSATEDLPITAYDVLMARRLLQRLRLARWFVAAWAGHVVVLSGGAFVTGAEAVVARSACADEVEALRAVIAGGGVPAGAVVHTGSEGSVIEAPRAFVLVQRGTVVAVSPRCPR